MQWRSAASYPWWRSKALNDELRQPDNADGTGFSCVLGTLLQTRMAASIRAKENAHMKMRSIIGMAYAAIAIAAAMPAAAQGVGDKVTPQFRQAITNIPGKSLVAVVVDYAP